jgi:hypothetical protein
VIGLLVLGFLAFAVDYILFVSFRDGVAPLSLSRHLAGRQTWKKADRPKAFWIQNFLFIGPFLALNFSVLAIAYGLIGRL